MKNISRFFDKLEDKIRGKLSRWPILYAFLGGIGLVLFWRGIWHTADMISAVALRSSSIGRPPLELYEIIDGPISIFASILFLLPTGLFVSAFIGKDAIISGIRGEKKLVEKTEQEIQAESGAIADIRTQVKKIADRVEEIDSHIHPSQSSRTHE